MGTLKSITALGLALTMSACGCEKYASQFSCYYVENSAGYEVWYWTDVGADDESDNALVGYTTGLENCEKTARAYAAATSQNFTDRAYLCLLIEDGRVREKHRNLS